MTLTSPKTHLIKFLEDTPESERNDILYAFLLFAPEIKEHDSLLEQKNFREFAMPVFKAWLDHHFDASEYAAVKVLTARTLIDFFVFRGKKSAEDFEKTSQEQQKLLEFAKNTQPNPEKIVNLLEEIREKSDVREMGWLVVADNWRQMCENELSDQYIEQWIKENPNYPQEIES